MKWNFQVAESRLVKAVFAQQHLLQLGQKCARFRALNDAVVIGAGDHQHFTQARAIARFFAGGRELSRKFDRAGGDDRALSRHQPRHRTIRADRARIGQRDGGAFEIGDLQFVRAGARDNVVVGRHELREVHAVGILDVRNFQRARAIFRRDVDRQADIHLRTDDAETLIAVLREGVVQTPDSISAPSRSPRQ